MKAQDDISVRSSQMSSLLIVWLLPGSRHHVTFLKWSVKARLLGGFSDSVHVRCVNMKGGIRQRNGIPVSHSGECVTQHPYWHFNSKPFMLTEDYTTECSWISKGRVINTYPWQPLCAVYDPDVWPWLMPTQWPGRGLSYTGTPIIWVSIRSEQQNLRSAKTDGANLKAHDKRRLFHQRDEIRAKWWLLITGEISPSGKTASFTAHKYGAF